jgi:hypothetical protein
LDFLGSTVGSSSSSSLPPSGGSPSGVKIGKGTGRPSFPEVVSSSGTISALGCRIPAQDSGTRVAAKIVLGSDEKGFLDFLAWTEDQRYDSDSPPKKEKKIKRKKGKREVKNL